MVAAPICSKTNSITGLLLSIFSVSVQTLLIQRNTEPNGLSPHHRKHFTLQRFNHDFFFSFLKIKSYYEESLGSLFLPAFCLKKKFSESTLKLPLEKNILIFLFKHSSLSLSSLESAGGRDGSAKDECDPGYVGKSMMQMENQI